MWHASAAADETAVKRYPWMDPGPRFRRIVRDDMDIFTALAAPDIDFANSRFPVPAASDPTAALSPERGCGVPMFDIASGRLRLRASAVLGLLGIAVFATENRGEQIPENYMLGWRQHIFHVYGWWGWQNHFREIVALTPITQYPLDFAEEWDHWAPVR